MTLHKLFSVFPVFIAVVLQQGCESDRVATEMDIASDRLDHAFSGLPELATATHRDYDYLLNRGGIRAGAPQPQEDGSYYLPFRADVSGASDITREAKKYTADIAVRRLVVEKELSRDPKRIYVYLETSKPGEQAPSPRIQGRNVGELPAGAYTLFYRNRDYSRVRLGSFYLNGKDGDPNDDESKAAGDSETDEQAATDK